MPLTYDAKDKALMVNDCDAEAVRTIFRQYLALGSVPKLRQKLKALGIVSKRQINRHGCETGGCAFSTGALYHLLRNPVYAGKVRHRGVLYEGLHAAIIDPKTWQAARDLLNDNGGGPIAGRRREAARWLDWRLFDRHGRQMRTTFATRSVSSGSVRQSKRYRYYASKPDAFDDERPKDRLPAGQIGATVLDVMHRQLSNRVWLASALSEAGASSDTLSDAIARAETIASAAINLSAGDERPSIEAFAHRIDLGEGRIDILLNLAPLLEGDAEQAVLARPISVPTTQRRQGRNRPIVVHAET